MISDPFDRRRAVCRAIRGQLGLATHAFVSRAGAESAGARLVMARRVGRAVDRYELHDLFRRVFRARDDRCLCHVAPATRKVRSVSGARLSSGCPTNFSLSLTFPTFTCEVLDKLKFVGHRSGTDYFPVNMDEEPELVCSASLRIYGDDLVPETVTELLGLEPDQQWRRGDKRFFVRTDGTVHYFDSV